MYLQVILNNAFSRLKGPLTYRSDAPVAPGTIVAVPFGKSVVRGVVVETAERAAMDAAKVRAIAGVDPELGLTPEQLKLARWMSAYYAAPLLDVLRLFVPAELWKKGLPKETIEVLTIPAADPAAVEALKRAPKQRAAYEQLGALTRIPLSVVTGDWGIERGTINQLKKRGLVGIVREDAMSAPPTRAPEEAPALTPDQQAAVDDILTREGCATHLVFGVTGSGKTEVYLQAIARELARGKNAYILVPEIALTPQTIGRVERRFPGVVGVIHSGLTEKEKLLTWARAARGTAKVIVGPRSALFAPLPDPGIIVIDEEHETTYKQEKAPRYHARDVAAAYASLLKIPLVLGSATPSVESFHAAKEGAYRYHRLARRVNPGAPTEESALPEISIVDLREERKAGNFSVFSEELFGALTTVLRSGRQAILFLNRRGYSPVLHCRSCGFLQQCPDCSVTMTVHKRRGPDGQEVVFLCHSCAKMLPVYARCPSCGGSDLASLGYGTQRVEEELRERFPGVRVLRADRDTTSGPNAHFEIYRRLVDNEADVLVGTQMIAKGLDLPEVDLVGILLADVGLALPDFRAQEQAFGLITQVAGRAGRRGRRGTVILQTYNPDALAIQAAVKNDVEGFLEFERNLRKQFGYPPFTRLAKLSLSEEHKRTAYDLLRAYAEAIRPRAKEAGIEVLGPVPAFIQKRLGKYTYHLFLKTPSRNAVEPFLKNLPKGTQIDIDPMSLA